MTVETFRDNVVIITGASSGIGKAMALQLANQGAWLSLASRDKERLGGIANQCLERGGRALVVQTDVSVRTQCEHMINRTVEEYGRIDTLVNNAGVTMWTLFEELQTLEPLEEIMQTNYFGSVYCTHYALPFLKDRKGRIIVVSSLSGKSGVPTRSGYAASKHAMVGFFDSLRIEIAIYGISITISYPDFVATEIRIRAYGSDGKPLGKSPVHEGEVMTSEQCAANIIRTAAKRRREEISTIRGKLGQWIKLISPGTVDKIAARAIEKGR
jgi:short-subunit dehydrogenase